MTNLRSANLDVLNSTARARLKSAQWRPLNIAACLGQAGLTPRFIEAIEGWSGHNCQLLAQSRITWT